jgi:hypothetical protein
MPKTKIQSLKSYINMKRNRWQHPHFKNKIGESTPTQQNTTEHTLDMNWAAGQQPVSKVSIHSVAHDTTTILFCISGKAN